MSRSLVVVAIAAALCAVTPVDAQQQRTFPLGGGSASGTNQPLPFGVSLYYFDQSQNYNVDSFALTPPVTDSSPADSVMDVENELTEFSLKFDMWLLPYLNLHVMVGQAEGQTTVDLDLPAPYDTTLDRIVIDYDGLVYGGGLTYLMGGEYYFGSLTAAYHKVDPDLDSSSISAWVITPKLGMNFSFGSFWVGAMYQEVTEKHKGTTSIPEFGDYDYDVELAEAEQWNYLAGVEILLTEGFLLQVEGGFGDRDHLLAALTYRF